MAYKPPKQTIVDNDLKNVPSNEAVFEALKLKLPKPSVDGTTGQLLARGASADDTSWVNPPSALPSQTGNLDKVLVTDGSNASWQYAGLGSGSFGSANTIIGRNKPTSLSGTENTIFGAAVGDSLSSGIRNVLMGVYAGGGITSGQGNVAIGYAAGYTSGYALLDTGIRNVLIGLSASTAAAGTNDAIAIGYSAVAALNGSSVGSEAARYNTGSNNTAIGYQSLRGTVSVSSGASNVAIGYQAGLALTTASNTVLIGASAGTGLTTGINNTLIGASSTLAASSTTQAVAIGASAFAADSSVAIGHQVNAAAGSNSANSVIIGRFANANGSNCPDSVLIGHFANSYTNGGSQGVGIGRLARVGNNSVAIGYGAQIGSGAGNIFIGHLAGSTSFAITGTNNVAIGKSVAVALTSGSTNIFIGNTAGDAVTTGSNNTIIGDVAGTTTLTSTLVLATGTTERIRHDDTKCAIQTGDLSVETVGKGLAIKSGTNAKIGTAQFTAQQTVTVNTTAVTANSLIFVAGQDGTDAFAVQNKIAGTSFEIHHPAGNTTALVAWMIVEATP